MRAFKEWRKPILKCERIGHDIFIKIIKIRKPHDGYGAVAEDYKAKIQICNRCLVKISKPYDEEYLDGYSGCTMPSSMWDKMREDGYIII
jgi:hypothetical protein